MEKIKPGELISYDEHGEPVLVGIPPKVAEAINNVMKDMGLLEKDERNKHSGYNFVGIDTFLEAVGPKCAEHGLIIVMDEVDCETMEITGSADKIITWLRLKYEFTLAHSSGEVWNTQIRRTGMANASLGSQAFGSAQSYALKNFMRSLFQIPTGDKEDSDNQEQTELPKQAPKKTAAKSKQTVGEWLEKFKQELDLTMAVNDVNVLVAREQQMLDFLKDEKPERWDSLHLLIENRRAFHANEPLGDGT